MNFFLKYQYFKGDNWWGARRKKMAFLLKKNQKSELTVAKLGVASKMLYNILKLSLSLMFTLALQKANC